MESLLHSAIANKELLLHFQPKVKSVSGEIVGFEALLRWQSPVLGFVPPDQFIPVAEQSGQIDGIGQWVIYNACRQMRRWMDKGLPAGSMAVNISGVQLRHATLPYLIQNILEEFKIEPHLLELELTESSLVDMQDHSLSMLHQFKEMGLQVTLDDFGTGYSSLSYLRNMPLGCIKIDRSFVNDIDKDQNANKLIASIISMAHELGLKVVAEGVEEERQVDHLAALGCEYLQGYYFSRPVPHDQVEDLLIHPPVENIT